MPTDDFSAVKAVYDYEKNSHLAWRGTTDVNRDVAELKSLISNLSEIDFQATISQHNQSQVINSYEKYKNITEFTALPKIDTSNKARADQPNRSQEANLQRFRYVIDQYQESPALIGLV